MESFLFGVGGALVVLLAVILFMAYWNMPKY